MSPIQTHSYMTDMLGYEIRGETEENLLIYIPQVSKALFVEQNKGPLQWNPLKVP